MVAAAARYSPDRTTSHSSATGSAIPVRADNSALIR